MNIAIYNLNQLGDFVFSLPLLHALKKRYPSCAITTIVPPALKSLSPLTPYIDDYITRKNGGLKFFKEIGIKNFDWWICVSRSPRAFLSAAASRAPRRIGFSGSLFSPLLTESIKHEPPFNINATVSLCNYLQLDPQYKDYRGLLSFTPELIKKEEERWKGTDFSKVIVIAPGSSGRKRFKRWPKEEYAKLIRGLCKMGFSISLTGAPGEYDELELIRNLSDSTATNLAGKLTLTELAFLLSKCRLLICNDSGSLHLASVFETPLIALYGPTSPAKSGPFNKNAHVIYSSELQKLSYEKVLERSIASLGMT